MTLNDLISKYRKELKEHLSDSWDIYANDTNHVLITYTVSYAKPKNNKNKGFLKNIKNTIKKLSPNYTEPHETQTIENTIVSIDVKNGKFYFSREAEDFFSDTISTLLEITEKFVDDYDKCVRLVSDSYPHSHSKSHSSKNHKEKCDIEIEDDCLDMWATNNKNVMVCYTLNNFKKENDNLVSFDILCDEKPIFEHVEWNGKSLKTLKVILLDKLTNMNIDNDSVNKVKNALFFCKLMNNNHFYLRVKSVAQKVLSEDCYYQYL